MAHTPRRGSLQVLAAIALGLAVTGSIAQGSPPPPVEKSADADLKAPEFDIVSVKQHKSDDGMRWMTKPDGFSTTNIPLQSLVASAYEIKQDLVTGGPSWINSLGFDVEAKVAGPDVATLRKLSGKQRDEMLRPLLAERFQLKVHVETKILPIYELVVAKGGVKMKASAPDPPPDPDAKTGDQPKGHRGSGMSMGPGRMDAQDFAMGALAGNLGYTVHRTVLDKTGLTGKYDFSLRWAPEEQMGAGVNASDAGGEAGPSIFTALEEQLGLRLNSSKGPVQTLVIDHVEMPTAN